MLLLGGSMVLLPKIGCHTADAMGVRIEAVLKVYKPDNGFMALKIPRGT
jgi:hypothetical protein